MQKKYWLILIIPIVLHACTSQQTAQEIVDSAILTHGGKAFDQFQVDFDFRDKHYTAIRNGGEFSYIRAFTDSTGTYRDVLNNVGFFRHKNDTLQTLPVERSASFTNSVNSVFYFALLPYGLNDAAVVKELISEEVVRGKHYFVVKISFKQEGGGTDFEDEFLFWIESEKFTVDYLAYTYHTNGGGIRFRQAINPKKVGGILWQDYVNYKPVDEKGTGLQQLMSLFNEGKLVELSRIELKNLQVSTDLN